MRASVALAVTALVLISGCAANPVGDDAGSDVTTTAVADEMTQSRPDPDSDVIGWESGYWYNESVSITTADGLNDSEIEKVVARSMARVERIRQLEFESQVPVEVVSREEFQRPGDRSAPDAVQTFDNAKYEALFMVNESTNALAIQQRNSGTSIGGFYSPSDERIVVVSENATSPQLDELTLGHELVHALQDQQFDLSKFNRSTREQHNAVDGLVEGDANYVQFIYERRCNDEWQGTCLGITEEEQGGTGQLANLGPYLIKFQPYSDGPRFLKTIRDDGGWKQVNDLYADPPASTEQVIHPELYGVDQPKPITIRDRSNAAWKRLDVPNRVDYGEVGEAGLFSMLVYPGIDTQGNQTVIDPQSFFTRERGDEGPTLDPYNYSHPATAGWDGDKLAVYVNDDAPPNETGYVWKTVWDSQQDAREFAEAYRKLLNVHGARQVDGRENAWVIPDSKEFADAFYVERRGDAVVIVNAPTVGQLSGVYSDATPDAESNASSRSPTASAPALFRSS